MQEISGLVSIITASYNMAQYIEQTLESLLAQNYTNLEIIVVDDGSTDDTQQVLAKYADNERIRVVQQENAGQTIAKNHGIAEARGQYVAFCDADDTWRHDKLSRQLPRFDNDPTVAVVFSDIRFIDAEGQFHDMEPMVRHEGAILDKLLLDNFVPFSSAIVRRSVLQEIGGFDESLAMSIDYDLWLRIAVHYRFAYVRQPLMNYRTWDGQMSHRMGKRLENFFRLLTRFLAEHGDVVTKAQQDHAWAHVHVTRATWHAKEGRRSEAWVDYRQALRLRPADRRTWRAILNFWLKRKKQIVRMS